MGLFDFVKKAGSKLFGDDDDKPAPKAAATPKQPDDFKAVIKKRRSAALRNAVASHGLAVDNLEIDVEGDQCTVRGTCGDQATREKVVLVIGNTEGIARVDDQLEVDSPEPEAQYHTVVSGDTLSKIAKKFYGNAGKYPVIFEANKPMLSDPDKIYPGQMLRIPPLAD